METPSDAVRSLLIKKKRPLEGLGRGFAFLHLSPVLTINPFPRDTVTQGELEFAYRPPPIEQKKKRREDRIPDYPQNRAARDFLKKQPVGRPPLGEGVNTNQCWRCKLHGHATGSRECPYFLVGNLEAEAERHVRDDPMTRFAAPSVVESSMSRNEKIQELTGLLESVKKAEKERKEKKLRKKEKKRKKERKRQKRLGNGNQSD